MEKENTPSIIYRLVLLALVVAEICGMSYVKRPTAIGILIFVGLWICKDIYELFKYYTVVGNGTMIGGSSSFGKNNEYWEHRFISNRSANASNGAFTTRTSSSHYKTYNETASDIIKMMKPSMNIVFDSEEKTDIVNKKKEEYYQNILKNGVTVNTSKSTTVKPTTVEEKKPIALLPAPSTNATNNLTNPALSIDKIINVINTSEINAKTKEVYDAIIDYISHHIFIPYTIHMALNTIRYVDVIPEIETANIYFTDREFWNKYNITPEEMAQHVKKKTNLKEVVIENYLVQSVSEYFTKQQDKTDITVIPTNNSNKIMSSVVAAY